MAKKSSFLDNLVKDEDKEIQEKFVEPTKSKKVEESSKNEKRNPNVKEIELSLDDLLDGLENYSSIFKISPKNIRLTEENHALLRRLKSTNVSMVELVNYLIHLVVTNEDYEKVIKKLNKI